MGLDDSGPAGKGSCMKLERLGLPVLEPEETGQHIWDLG